MNSKIFIFFLTLASGILCLSATSQSQYDVKYVYDGDTILLDTGEKVRYLGIDAPEIDHKHGNSEFLADVAWDLNRRLLKARVVRLESDQVREDHHGRRLAYVFLENGQMVNALMLTHGLAHVMMDGPGLKYKDLLLETQRQAMTEKIGIWNRCVRNEDFYMGNRASFRFHRPDCSLGKQISPGNRVRFDSRFDAFWEGYSPCRRCQP